MEQAGIYVDPVLVGFVGSVVLALAGAVGLLWRDSRATARAHSEQLDAVHREYKAQIETLHQQNRTDLVDATNAVTISNKALRESNRELLSTVLRTKRPGSSAPPPASG